jgi:2-desacetyl-2-hydroxyethyl bacteriochlorophyllide A dehydrogenase
MRAAVTVAPNEMSVRSVEEPVPGPNDVIVRPELVGVCGSDIHFFSGHLDITPKGSSLYPRIQGHEFAGTVESAGRDAAGQIEIGARVAVWPLASCGRCYPCRVGRRSVCDDFELIGIHRDGGLADLVRVPIDQTFPVGDLAAALAALVEPMAVAVHGVARGAVRGEQVVVLGGGPIGQAVSLAAQARGARVLLVEPIASRQQLAVVLGAELALGAGGDDLVSSVLEWTSGEGAPVVIDATGVPEAIRLAVDLVSSAGRVVVLGISDQQVALPIGLFTSKEFDIRGSSCHEREDVEEAIRLVSLASDVLEPYLRTEFALEDAAEALEFHRHNREAAIKVMVRVSG